jgi:hypothetical protein
LWLFGIFFHCFGFLYHRKIWQPCSLDRPMTAVIFAGASSADFFWPPPPGAI